MTLRLYNTLTKQKEALDDLPGFDPKNVRMYVCGPTVYDFAHIGNARPVIVFDVLFRLLRHIYGAGNVTYVRNITDVDDKINARAAQEYPDLALNDAIRKVTEKTEKQFHEDVAALGCLPPTHEPRATEHIVQMVAMTERLIAAGHAYAKEGHVLYRVSSKPDYGKLARRSVNEMLAGARVEVAPYKENPMDFVLWKPSKPGEPSWPSPWSEGRPGWHIECSAMSEALLGKTFDIHGGGIDLVFPHHENEIAQSESVHSGHPLARVWMHNGFLQVEGEKMSKSLGNFVTIDQLLTRWGDYSWPGEALRFNMLRTNYRQPIDWTFDGLDESHKILWDWYDLLDRKQTAIEYRLESSFIEAVSDDLNLPQAFAELHSLRRAGKVEELRSALQFLGFSCSKQALHRTRFMDVPIAAESWEETDLPARGPKKIAALNPEEVTVLIEQRNAARKAKNFNESDRIRDELLAKGIVLKDGPTGTTWEVKR